MEHDVKKLRITTGIIVGAVILMLIIPIAIHFISKQILFNGGELLAFCGSVLGGGVGGLAALIAIYYTLKYYNQKDTATQNVGVFERQVERIDGIISQVRNRDIVSYDTINTIRMPEEIILKIQRYNDLTGHFRGFFTEQAISILRVFKDEYEGRVRRNAECVDRDREFSVIGFLDLKEEIRSCAERIGKYALYENANELLHGDSWISYILEIEAGGSAGLWASSLHDKHSTFDDDETHYNMLLEYFRLIESLIINLESFKETEYTRIVVKNEASIAPVHRLKKEYKGGNFLWGEEIKIETRKD